jgi:hypothetical protein
MVIQRLEPFCVGGNVDLSIIPAYTGFYLKTNASSLNRYSTVNRRQKWKGRSDSLRAWVANSNVGILLDSIPKFMGG